MKLTFKPLRPQRTYLPYKNMKKGDLIIDGLKYVGTSESKFGTNYDFEDMDGNLKTLNNSGALEYALKEVPVGTYLQIIYDGKKLLETGDYEGKECHTFKINKGHLEGEEEKEVKLTETEAKKDTETQIDLLGL
jgi:hypothetical protein